MSTITLQVDQAGRQFLLDNDEKISILYAMDNDSYAVVCAFFSPFGNSDTVALGDDIVVYVSTGDVAYGETVRMGITEPATPNNFYIFDGVDISSDGKKSFNGQYGLLNQRTEKTNVTCGLGQDISINGTSQTVPVSIYSNPYNQTITMGISSKIWILAAQGLSQGLIIDPSSLSPNNQASDNFTPSGNGIILGNYLEIDLSVHPNPSVTFDDTSHQFTLTG